MARRWTEEDLEKLKSLAKHLPAPSIAEKLDRPTGGVAFKAYQLGLSLRTRASESKSPLDTEPAGFKG
jgi:hypothetical protein